MKKLKIKPSLSITYTKKANPSNAMYPSGTSGGILEYLVSTSMIIDQVMELSSKMLDALLPDGFITVGKSIELTHEHATLMGENIIFHLMVTKVEKEHVFLDVTVSDAVGVICRGKYERAIVNKEELLDHAYRRAAKATEDLVL